MNQIKIGQFIAEKRKENGFTQMQLAEMLGITDRAISKWERGKAMPDYSIILDLCDKLKISINDLLCGEVVSMDNYNKELENNLLDMIKQKEENDKRLLTLEWVIAILACIVLFVPVFVAAYLPLENTLRIVIAFSGFIPGLIGLFVAMRIEQVAGYYVCKECDHKYVPTYKAVNLAPHMGRTRYMRCPECGKKSWQKKVISKD